MPPKRSIPSYPDRYAAACLDKRVCPFRACMWPGEDKGSFTMGVGYTSYHVEPIPTCMTRHTQGCPTPLPESDPEEGRCCYRPSYQGRAIKGVKTCSTCGKAAPAWAAKVLDKLPTRPGVPCKHPIDQVSRTLLMGWRECRACKGVWDKEIVLPHEVPSRTLDELLDEARRRFSSVHI